MADKNIGDLIVRVRTEGDKKAKKQLSDIKDGGIFSGGLTGDGKKGKEGNGGDGALSGILDGIMGMGTKMLAMVAGVMAIAGILLSMEPIQKLLSAFMKIVQAFFTPLAMMLITLLSPVLRFLVKLLPLWFEFFRDPIGMIKKGLAGLADFFGDVGESIVDTLGGVGQWLWDGLSWIGGIIRKVVFGEAIFDAIGTLIGWVSSGVQWLITAISSIPGKVGDFIVALPGNIAEALGNFFSGLNPLEWFQTGGSVPSTGVYGLHKNEAVFNQSQLRLLENALRSNQGNQQVMISGGLAPFIERIQKNPDIGGF